MGGQNRETGLVTGIPRSGTDGDGGLCDRFTSSKWVGRIGSGREGYQYSCTLS